MSILAVYGVGGLGREVLELAKTINEKNKKWESFIFIDDGDVPGVVNGVSVYKYDEAVKKFGKEIEIAMGIGEPRVREILFNKIAGDGIGTPTLIHPEVHIPESTVIGKGVVIQYGCFISCNVKIGDYVYIQPHCNIGHDDVLDKGCMISGFGNLAGIVHVGEFSYVGMSAAVKETVNIGSWSVVGMCSMVHKDIPDEMVALGNPARPIAKNSDRRVFGH
ncbi:MAG: NeuD/PglB/VioB family sugar acetyltransferase [Clostridiales bacterium]|nr:NeuD/PglB/VioB family sugar acetyltransferase [Clostridiales bacterium]